MNNSHVWNDGGTDHVLPATEGISHSYKISIHFHIVRIQQSDDRDERQTIGSSLERREQDWSGRFFGDDFTGLAVFAKVGRQSKFIHYDLGKLDLGNTPCTNEEIGNIPTGENRRKGYILNTIFDNLSDNRHGIHGHACADTQMHGLI